MTCLGHNGRRRSEARGGHGHRHWVLLPVVLAAVALVAAACGGASTTGTQSSKAATPTVHTGGTLTMLEGANLIGDYPEGLDPMTNLDTLLGNSAIMDAIYGEFFEIGAGDKLVPDLATGYHLTNGGKTLTLDLRHGVKFSDGTPFDASAVIFNFKADLGNKTDSANPSWPTVTSITAPNAYTVVVHFATPDGAAVNQMLSTTVSWIVSPTALKRLGAKAFALKPVAAGPFEVVSDTPSVKLVLKRNPYYWQKGRPYLNGLTFLSVDSDESALEDLEAHDAQAYQYMTTPALRSSYRSAGFTATTDPGTEALDVQINDGVAPFTSLKAREALYYALDATAFDQAIFKGTCPISQSFTGPSGLFYMPTVPGYRTYDLAKAKALVKQIGGLSFTLYYSSAGLGSEEATALQTMYDDAGMHVKIKGVATLSAEVAEYDTHKWQAWIALIGSYDPAGGIGVSFRLASTGPFTGIDSLTVDKYINEGAESVSTTVRKAAYLHLAEYLSQEAYTPFICSADTWNIAAKGVTGPGLTTAYGGGEGPAIQWQNVSMDNG